MQCPPRVRLRGRQCPPRNQTSSIAIVQCACEEDHSRSIRFLLGVIIEPDQTRTRRAEFHPIDLELGFIHSEFFHLMTTQPKMLYLRLEMLLTMFFKIIEDVNSSNAEVSDSTVYERVVFGV